MEEKLLHYVWEGFRFNFLWLWSSGGERIILKHPGTKNSDQGPDFLEARFWIGYLEFCGDVEIHVCSKEWYEHGHHLDPMYNGVALHVVYEKKGPPAKRQDGTEIPELELKGLIQPEIFENYEKLKFNGAHLPCKTLLDERAKSSLLKFSVSLSVERVKRKAQGLRTRLIETLLDWDQVLWEEMAGTLGGPVNQASFRALARALPVKLLQKLGGKPFASEALIFGMAGMLTAKTRDEYQRSLFGEWEYQKATHFLKTQHLPFRFFRMRPAAFPTIRLSQLASVVRLFPVLSELLLTSMFDKLLHCNIQASDYWKTHSRFGVLTPPKSGTLGIGTARSLIINTLVPMSWLYYNIKGRTGVEWFIAERLMALPAEDNLMLRHFAQEGIVAKHAMHSQGLIELKKKYCAAFRCLECRAGKEMVGWIKGRHPDEGEAGADWEISEPDESEEPPEGNAPHALHQEEYTKGGQLHTPEEEEDDETFAKRPLREYLLPARGEDF